VTGVDAKGGGIYLADNETQANTTIQNSIIKDNTAVVSGGGLFGLFDPPHNGKVIIENSDFRGNQASASGAIYTVRAHISGSLFDDNHATVGDAGAVFIPSLVLTDTVFTNNTAADDAGAIFGQGLIATNIRVENNEALDSGGGVYFIGTGTKDISNSMVLSNTAATGGGIYISGSDGTRSHISQTAVAYNKASSDGGGIYANESALSMSNSTISTNQANSSGGGFYIDASSIITATNITVALNMLGQDIFKEGELTLQNSIIHTPDTPNCNFVVTPINSLGHNLTDDASCDGLNQTGDEINPDVGLAPLADNGGNTLTHALLDGSPALDSGNAAACAAAPVNNVDQRGILRTIGASCDKGAFERGAVVYLPVIIR
jgi:predicted outer membrane repeat protein